MMLLKSTSKGSVKLSLSKPVPYSKFKNDDDKIIIHNDQDMNNNQRLSCITKTKTTTHVHHVFACQLNQDSMEKLPHNV
ncbi:unnamed protein product [Rotaria sp. Silwood1]|nr:unnamed protein product [Rotaria sp. Silwood1]CAF1462949.1 unnamed protein product [Rotaria sp. Silwood1]CAF4882122.1 unnamed protein product [Rotaria sp. Silwood1]